MIVTVSNTLTIENPTAEMQMWCKKHLRCYKMQSEVPDWGSDTKWLPSALNILKGGSDVY